MERERRTTMAENNLVGRRIQQMERENKELRDRAFRNKSDIDKHKGEHSELTKKHRELEQIINEMGRKSNINERELAELRRQFQAERRQSISLEEAILRLQRDNKNNAAIVADLKSELTDNKAEINDLTDKNGKAK